MREVCRELMGSLPPKILKIELHKVSSNPSQL